MSARLTVHLPFQPARSLFARSDAEYVLGRDPGCDLALEDDRVSRRHARLHFDAGAWRLEDLGSKNGTTVNGHAARVAELEDGAWISLGGLLARFELVNGERQVLESVRHEERWRTTVSLQRRLDPTLGLDRLLERLLESAMSLVSGERGFILLRSPGGELEVATRSGLALEDIEAEEFAGSVGAIERALESGRPVAVSDAQSETFLKQRLSVVTGGIRGLVCLPLAALERDLGVLYVDSREPGATYDELDVEILEALASHGALAIAVASLDRELKGLASSLPARAEIDSATLQTEIGTLWERALPARRAAERAASERRRGRTVWSTLTHRHRPAAEL